MSASTRPVLIMAGGTGGHIFPGLAVADVLRAHGVPVAWLGARGGMETQVVPAHGIELHEVPVGGLRGKGWKTRLGAPLMLARALLASLAVLRRVRPRSVLSMGGYVAGPGGLAARLTGTPLLVHEQNSVAGYTNRKLAGFARRVLTGFDGALPNGVWVGNPVRASIAALAAPAERMAGRSGPARRLVLGGPDGGAGEDRGGGRRDERGRRPADPGAAVSHRCRPRARARRQSRRPRAQPHGAEGTRRDARGATSARAAPVWQAWYR